MPLRYYSPTVLGGLVPGKVIIVLTDQNGARAVAHGKVIIVLTAQNSDRAGAWQGDNSAH